MAMCSLLIVYHESSKAWIQTCAEYKHTGRKMSSTYLDMSQIEVLMEWKSLQFVTSIFSPKAKKEILTRLLL